MSIKLPSGKEIYPYNGVVGLDDNGVVFGGYDSVIFDRTYSNAFDDEPNLSITEQIELAELMIERWKLLKAVAEKEKAIGSAQS